MTRPDIDIAADHHDTTMLQQHTRGQLCSLRLDCMIAALIDSGMRAAAQPLPFE